MIKYIVILIISALGMSIQAQPSCSFDIDNGNNDYTLNFDLSYNDAVLTQMGTTCNVTIDVDYLIDLDFISADFGPINFINIGLDCGTTQQVIDVTVPGGNSLSAANSSISGTLSIGSFDFPNTACSGLSLACEARIFTSGAGGLNEQNTPCGNIAEACARSIF